MENVKNRISICDIFPNLFIHNDFLKTFNLKSIAISIFVTCLVRQIELVYLVFETNFSMTSSNHYK